MAVEVHHIYFLWHSHTLRSPEWSRITTPSIQALFESKGLTMFSSVSLLIDVMETLWGTPLFEEEFLNFELTHNSPMGEGHLSIFDLRWLCKRSSGWQFSRSCLGNCLNGPRFNQSFMPSLSPMPTTGSPRGLIRA